VLIGRLDRGAASSALRHYPLHGWWWVCAGPHHRTYVRPRGVAARPL